MFRIKLVMLVLMFSSIPVKSEVLNAKEEVELLSSNPDIIGSFSTNRSLQFWILSSNKKGVIWCETFVNEDKVRTETICFDDLDPDG